MHCNLTDPFMATRSIRPATLFPGRGFGEWFVLRTRARQEKRLAADLRAKGIGHCLPMLRRERLYGERSVYVESPLFAGFLFLRGSLEDSYFADRTGRVAQIITVADQFRLDSELTQLAQVIDANLKIDPFPYLKMGTRVAIRSGPLRGIQGLIEGRAWKDRLILQIEALGLGVSVGIDAAIVELVA